MAGNTPQFNTKLAEYYTAHSFGIKKCLETGEEFEISLVEYELYKSLHLPLPVVSPMVRHRRQRAWIGGLDLFRRVDTVGQTLISMYDPQSPAQILPTKIWYADEFEAMSYGREINPELSFFEQWFSFSHVVPRPCIIHDVSSENSDWCLYDLSLKDCYLTFGGVGNENVLYSDFCVFSKFCIDCTSLVKSEWCYEAVQCAACSHTFFSERCDSCLNIYFCFSLFL